ncbi:hypothetical protein DDB_G0294198 [Dictyostelium discoideum AX4]|uniref:Uncharacterized protein n=1 Tax=Dictyostelium discoideum TaxID=44689 RepID=Q54AU7_DICDI|nr:hypothetical protein DDB_G0294198 [Dictyostelium discoideum AX4]EAL60386.1 hypothetical protein DDB_G0294198 [Dictyostelium discoideum AX4]|eukprot:XP_628799.1 hypothetical protein DDB_G0294198 [Dictyostelium discoideum AX4]
MKVTFLLFLFLFVIKITFSKYHSNQLVKKHSDLYTNYVSYHHSQILENGTVLSIKNESLYLENNKISFQNVTPIGMEIKYGYLELMFENIVSGNIEIYGTNEYIEKKFKNIEYLHINVANLCFKNEYLNVIIFDKNHNNFSNKRIKTITCTINI